jgi:hypothetical protein
MFRNLKNTVAVFLSFCSILVLMTAVPTQAADNFLFGVETHFRRLWWDGGSYGIPGKSTGESYRILMDFVDDLGVNLIRDGNRFIDMMGTEGVVANMDYVNDLLKDLQVRNVKLDWVIVEVPDWAKDLSSGHENNDNYPPKIGAWKDFMSKIAQETQSYSNNIIWEQWNEPDLQQFWSGTTQEYIALLDAGASSIKSVVPSPIIINGGLTIDDLNKDYFDPLKTRLADGTINWLAIHSHGDIATLDANYKNNVLPHDVSPNRIFVNESGNYASSSAEAQREQAKNVAGKAIYSLGHGFRGYVAYYLGGVDKDKNADLNADAPTGNYYFLVDDNCERRMSYYAYKTVITNLRGVTETKIVHEGDGRYEYLFSKGSQRIYVAIGGKSNLAEVTSRLGTSDYKTYDTLNAPNGSVTDIQYFIAESLQPPSITEQPKPQSVSVGESVRFNVKASGTMPISYQWQKFNGNLWSDNTGATGSTYQFSAQLSDNGNRYRVIVTNRAGSTISEAVTLTVTSTEPEPKSS